MKPAGGARREPAGEVRHNMDALLFVKRRFV